MFGLVGQVLASPFNLHFDFDGQEGGTDFFTSDDSMHLLRFSNAVSRGSDRPKHDGGTIQINVAETIGNVTAPTELPFNSEQKNELTLACWVEPLEARDATLIQIGTLQAPTFVANLGILENGHAQVSFYHGREWVKIESNDPVEIGTWTHLALVFENGLMSLFVNGVHDSEVNTLQPMPMGLDYIAVGGGGGLGQFFGGLDEVRITDVALNFNDFITP